MFPARDQVSDLVGKDVMCSLPATRMLCVLCRRPGLKSCRHECCVFPAGDLVSGLVGKDVVFPASALVSGLVGKDGVCSLSVTWFRVL